MNAIALPASARDTADARNDRRFRWLLTATAVFVLVTLAGAALSMLWGGRSVLASEGLGFFFSTDWNPVENKYGALVPIYGTVVTAVIAMLIAVPVSFGIAFFLTEVAPRWLRTPVGTAIELLAGVPSIIYGLLALGLLVYQLNLGESILTAGLTLAMLILPIVIVSTREAIRAVPQAIREASYGLGASKWQTVRHHVLPYSMPGILTGVIIGLSRAIGETAPIITIGALTFIAFLPPPPLTTSAPFVNMDWLFSPFTVMPIQMFNWVSRPDPQFHTNAAAAGVVLVAMTLLMNACAIWLRYRARQRIKW